MRNGGGCAEGRLRWFQWTGRNGKRLQVMVRVPGGREGIAKVVH